MKSISRILLTLTAALVLSALALPATAQESSGSGTSTPPTSTPIPRPLPSTTLDENGVTVELYFDSIPQGQVGVVHVMGDGIQGARMRVFSQLIDFFPIDGDGFYGLVAVNMEQSPRTYDLAISVGYENGQRATIDTQVEVTLGEFIRQDIAVADNRAYLIDPQVERSEFARLDSIVANVTPERMWHGPFQYPINSELTSPFGAFRTMNESVQTRHTGWDLRAGVGTPIMAMGPGRVAFTGPLDIRGNYVLIDHGYGIYSGYAHLSQIHVTRGQTVAQGQIIGLSGDTGRSNGPHMHWEVIVNGQWVDSAAFQQMWLPGD